MKTSRRIAVIAAREIKRLVAQIAMRAAQAESTATCQVHLTRSPPSFRPLTDSEAGALLGGELLAALSGARSHAGCSGH
jgi:hypothetical protein